MPDKAFSAEFVRRLVPYLIVNQLLFVVVSWGLPNWRGQQYSLALFPIWIKSVTSAIGSVYFGQKLGFVVTPKTRQEGVSLRLIRWQLIVIVLLVAAVIVGLCRLALDPHHDVVPIVVNIAWALFDLAALSVVLKAAFYKPVVDDQALPLESAATLHGRAGSGGK
jgi:cellulose synthase (UDP-forming)